MGAYFEVLFLVVAFFFTHIMNCNDEINNNNEMIRSFIVGIRLVGLEYVLSTLILIKGSYSNKRLFRV